MDFLKIYVIITSVFGLIAVMIIMAWLWQVLGAVRKISETVAVEVQRRSSNENRLTNVETDIKEIHGKVILLEKQYIAHSTEETAERWARLGS